MKNMTIARKLIAGFILVTIIAVFIGIFGISQMRKIEKADNYLYEKKTVPLVKLMNVADNFERAAANIAYCLYEKETGDFLEIADNAMQEAESNFSLYENASDDDNEDDLHLEMKVSWNEYKFYYDSLRWFALTEKYDEGIVWRRKDKGRTRRDFRAAVVKVVERDILEARLSAENNTTTANRASTAIFVAIAIGVLAALILGFLIARSIAGKLNVMVSVANSIAQGHLDNPIKTAGNDEVAKLALSLDKMQTALSEARKESNRQDWLKTGIMKLNDVMAGEPDIETLASNTISEITRYIDAQVGAFYVANDSADLSFSLIGSYAYTKRKNLSNVFKAGEGLVGQAALEKQQILIKNVPHDYIKVTSGLGERIASFICVTPFIYEKRVKGVIETGTLGEMTDMQMEYLRQAMPALAIAVESAQSRIRLTQSLEESRTLTEELRRQQEELKAANEELEEQTQRLVESERKMQSQQEELKVSNEELEERNEALQMQKKEIERTKKEVEAQAEELATASKYKSEFLANMSHELRTPLNSLLILSRMLADNKEGNLSKDQVESADIIYKSGDVLLSIINEILDLSRIEAGQMDLHIGYVFIKTLADNITNSFKHIIDEKGLSLIIRVDEKMPEFIESDEKRLEQVIRNLMSNAIKFTNTGNITVDFRCTPKTAALYRSGLFPENSIAVIVKDTGIGIAKGKQKIIFEAFQQAEGGTAREYGGTGLGLSISREIVNLLGGEIQVESQPGKGSTFTVYLPLKTGQTGKRQALAGIYNGVTERELNSKTLPKAQAEISVSDDREHLTG
ncbi:MAG: MCP four helix bundle domain-containing protein, partial [Bacteroidetes bacterium]|nr:MCP four helix bundle domain-containing protein [Bacteroidota bacterium]